MKYYAEMWDKMQHIMANYNDHMVHFYIRFDTTLDEPILKRALAIATDKVPILKTIFSAGLLHAEWNSIDDFKIDDVYKFIEVERNAQAVSEKFLLQIIKESREAQIKYLLVREGGTDTLNILMNHMCFDGADFKQFAYLIAKIYNELKAGGTGDFRFKNGTRSETQLFNSFSPEERKEVEGLISYSKKQKAKISFPFETKKKKLVTPRIIKNTVSSDTFMKLKERGKELGFSVNDVICACFFRATVASVNLNKGDALGIPNMVDLRRYMPGGQSFGMCNLTSMVVPNLGEDIGKDIFETVAKVKANMDELKTNHPGLHGLPLLRKVFALTPYALAHFLIGTFFKNPLIGISNIGVIDDTRLVFNGASVEEAYITGSVKYPPYMQLALSTFKGNIINTVAVYCTDNDEKMFRKMFDLYNQEIQNFIA